MNAFRPWSRDETILAFELYCTIPSGKVTVNNIEIIELARALDRTANSVKLKLQNFKSYDPQYIKNGRIGLDHASKLDGEIVREFLEKSDELVQLANQLKCSYHLRQPEDTLEGHDIITTRKARVGQTFFRNTLLSAYNGACCITGMNIPRLLKASHIKPWAHSNDINEKTNPQNGLLLNAIFDAAFDNGYITIDSDYKVVVSTALLSNPTMEYIQKYNGMPISLPNKFYPSSRFIEYHNKYIFISSPHPRASDIIML